MHAITVRDAQIDQQRKHMKLRVEHDRVKFFRLLYFDPITDHTIDPMIFHTWELLKK